MGSHCTGTGTGRLREPAIWRELRDGSGEERAIRVLIADAQEVVRIGLRTFLRGERDLRVVGETTTIDETLGEAGRLKPDVILLDGRLAGDLGGEACRKLLDAVPEVRIFLLTQSGSELDRTKAAAVGAPGWISKTLGRGQLLEAVRSVVYKTGQPLPSPASGGARRAWDSATWSEGTVEHVQRLSHQEKRMLPMVAEGKTNKEIARTLGLSDKTVKNYLANVFSKLGVRRRSQVAALYVQGAVTVGETRGWDSSVIGG